MPNPTVLTDLSRYAGTIADLLGPRLGKTGPFIAEAEDADHLQVERALVFPLAQANPGADVRRWVDRLIDLGQHSGSGRVAIVDRLGHQREVYRALLVYSWLRAYTITYERLPRSEFGRWEEGLRPWCELLEEILGVTPWPESTSAAHGSAWAQIAWSALALQAAGKLFVRDAWTDTAGDAWGRLVHRQQGDGAFLMASAGDSPETHGYHELVILHAAASYAVAGEDRVVAAAVVRNTVWQQSQQQPDHASMQPWGLFGFIWNPATHPLADAMLHTCQLGEEGGVSLMLLADALYCLRLFGT